MAYPNDIHYDPNRPSWVPFWIDTPTEVRKLEQLTGKNTWYPGGLPDVTIWNDNQSVSKLPTLPPSPAAPQTVDEMLNWTPELLNERDKANFLAWDPFDKTPTVDLEDKEKSEHLMYITVVAGLLYLALLRE